MRATIPTEATPVRVGRSHDPEENAARAAARSYAQLPQAAAAANPQLSAGSGRVGTALSAPGTPLPPPDRAYFERRLGSDLAHVRLHTDAAAGAAARSVGARAFAMGNRVAFAPGAYRPETEAGRALMAHELTHTLQPGAARMLRRDPAPNTSSLPEPPMLGPYVEDIPGGRAGLRLQAWYPHLAARLTPGQWAELATGAARREANQGNQTSDATTRDVSLEVPLALLLDAASRFTEIDADVDVWDLVFKLVRAKDTSTAAGLLIRNEIVGRWFRVNAIRPEAERVTIVLLDPHGAEEGPAQLEFRWRGKPVSDSEGSLSVQALDEVARTSLMVDTLGSITRDASRLASAAALQAQADDLGIKLPAFIDKTRADFSKAQLNEIVAYRVFVDTAGDEAQRVLIDQAVYARVPDLQKFYDGYAVDLSLLENQMRDWMVGATVLGQNAHLSDAEIANHLYGGEDDIAKAFWRGDLSRSDMQDLYQSIADRALIVGLVSIALTFATMGLGEIVAAGVGLAEGTIVYSAVATGTEFATINVATMGYEHLLTSLKDFDNPYAEAVWRQGAHSPGDYLKGAALGFGLGGAIGTFGNLVFRAFASRGSTALLATASAGEAGAGASANVGAGAGGQPYLTILSDVTDPVMNLRTVQLSTAQNELVTIVADVNTGSGYIINNTTGEARQIIEGELGGPLNMGGAGEADVAEQAGGLQLVPQDQPMAMPAQPGGLMMPAQPAGPLSIVESPAGPLLPKPPPSFGAGGAPPTGMGTTVLSQTTDAVSGVQSMQMVTQDGDIVTFAKNPETGDGFILSSRTGAMLRVSGGKVVGPLNQLGEGAAVEAAANLPPLLAENPQFAALIQRRGSSAFNLTQKPPNWTGADEALFRYGPAAKAELGYRWVLSGDGTLSYQRMSTELLEHEFDPVLGRFRLAPREVAAVEMESEQELQQMAQLGADATSRPEWLARIREGIPQLAGMGDAALGRVLAKAPHLGHMTGELVEVFAAEALEQRATAEGLEFIAPHRLKALDGRQLTDGMLICRTAPQEAELVQGEEVVQEADVARFGEAKAGAASARGLRSETGSFSGLEPGSQEWNNLEEYAIDVLRKRLRLSPTSAKTPVTMTNFRATHAAEIEAEMKELYATGGGQIERDLERLMPGVSNVEEPLLAGPQLDEVPVTILIDDQPVRVRVSRSTTRVTVAAPADVNLQGAATYAGQFGIGVDIANIGLTAQEVETIARQLRAEAVVNGPRFR